MTSQTASMSLKNEESWNEPNAHVLFIAVTATPIHIHIHIYVSLSGFERIETSHELYRGTSMHFELANVALETARYPCRLIW